MRVAVCVITYKRPQGLTRLLEGLNALTFQERRPHIRVIVVDNDDAGSAYQTCEAVRPRFNWELECYVEPRRGIPFARNTAIARAGNDADYIAFIDDDEVPEPNWLDELLRVMAKYEADVVAGPAVPHFMKEPPLWVIKGEFFASRRRTTGERLDRAATNNVMIRSAVLRAMANLFDERMALTGGSDIHLFRRVHRAGYRIVWADEALTTEWIPPSRVGTMWILRRAFRVGASTALTLFDLHSPIVAAAYLVVGACFRIVMGGTLLPVASAMGAHEAMKRMRQVYQGAGMVAGLFGMRYQEYRRTHGS